jgi:hypothetical protein
MAIGMMGGMANLLSMLQMQQNQVSAANVGLETQIQQRLGAKDPGGTAHSLIDIPDDSTLSPEAQLANAKQEVERDSAAYNQATQALTPQQRAEIEQRVQRALAEAKKNGVPGDTVDENSIRMRETMAYAGEHLKQSLKNGQPIDPGLNKIFTSGTKLANASVHYAVLSAAQQDRQTQALQGVPGFGGH